MCCTFYITRYSPWSGPIKPSYNAWPAELPSHFPTACLPLVQSQSLFLSLAIFVRKLSCIPLSMSIRLRARTACADSNEHSSF
eukprot:6391985-Heterocapsa_arctica.AAC.1